MKTISMAAVALTFGAFGTAAAQEDQDDGSGRYFAIGGQAAFGIDDAQFEDGALVDIGGGYGAFARYGDRINRYFGWEAEAGFAAFDGADTLVNGGAFAVGTLPLGPVDLRARGGLGANIIGGNGSIGTSIGMGVGIEVGEGQRIVLDATAISTALDTESEGGVGILQLGYQRRF